MGDTLSQAEIDALLGGGFPAADDSSSDADEANDFSLFPTDVPDVSMYVDTPKKYDDAVTSEQKDILGEIGNISMGTAATTLFALLNQKVWITTPKVNVYDWQTLSGGYDRPCVGIRVDYKEGLMGSNILILKERDVKIIADLMMGGSGDVTEPVTLTELDMSAIGEAMNQMVGSSSTSLSSMIKRKIDINTPVPFMLEFQNDSFFETVGFAPDDVIVCISFKMEIGTLIDSEIMQILPIDFAIDMVEKLMSDMMGAPEPPTPAPEPVSDYTVPQPQDLLSGQDYAAAYGAPQSGTQGFNQQQPAPGQMPGDMGVPYGQQVQPQAYGQPTQPGQPPVGYAQPDQSYGPMPGQQGQPYGPMPGQPGPQGQPPYGPMPGQAPYGYAQPGQPYYGYPPQTYMMPPPDFGTTAKKPEPNVNVQPAQFMSFDMGTVIQQKENMGIIMDVPLEITVELGRTHKKIQEILEFAPGTIVELDKLAGEPIDILVNGKFVAKGEVVVIDENFGIRITDIISVEKRI